MAQYKIEWMEKKQISGKDIIEASLSGEGVTPAEKVTIWKTDTKGEEFPGFDEIMPGHTVEGNLWSKPGSNFKTLYPVKEKKTGNGNFRAQLMEKAQDRKETSIAKAQDNKEWGIKTSSTMRMAVDLAIAEIQREPNTGYLHERIKYWREWCWNNWDVAEDQFPPFN